MTENNDRFHDMTGHLDKDYNHIVFSSDDQRLKILGEIFGNNTSRSIITILIENNTEKIPENTSNQSNYL